MNKSLVHKGELIKRRRKKRFVKKTFIFFIFLLTILATLCLQLPYFKIGEIVVSGNKNVSTDEIIKESAVYKGNNIFYTNLRKSKSNILGNPYILSGSITRKLPNKIYINVIEREAAFYNILDNKAIIIDKKGIVLEKTEGLGERKLVKLDGVDFLTAVVGKVISVDDKRKIDTITTITELITTNSSNLIMSSVNLHDLMDIQVYYGKICVKLGNTENLNEKLNKAINILSREELKEGKGYIDVSFKGNPVFFIEK